MLKDIESLNKYPDPKPAAVLLLMIEHADDWKVVITRRSFHLREHAGEFAFPGGRPEAGESLELAALREAFEEIGAHSMALIGRLSSVPLYTSNHRITPYLSTAPAQIWHPNPGEVATVQELSLRRLLSQEHISAVLFESPPIKGLSPFFEINAEDGQNIIGATAHILYELMKVVAEAWGTACPSLKCSQDLQSPLFSS